MALALFIVQVRSDPQRGVRKILARYSLAAGFAKPISPHELRHFLLTWLKKRGIDDAAIQPYSGHASRQSLEIYSRLALSDRVTGPVAVRCKKTTGAFVDAA